MTDRTLEGSQQLKLISFSCFRFLLLFLSIWVLFFIVDRRFPYIRPGAEIVLTSKREAISSGKLFAPESSIRVAVFGDSRVLSGFIPEVFDRTVGNSVASYNLGLPDTKVFLKMLESFASAEANPTHVLLTLPWSEKEDQAGYFELLQDDRLIINSIFPFRNFPRNLTLFTYQSLRSGGFRNTYESARGKEIQILNSRGYYFIEQQSHFPNHELPDDYRLPTDTPGNSYVRDIRVGSESFSRLIALAEAKNFKILFVPAMYRRGTWLENDKPNIVSSTAVKNISRVVVLGPDAWFYENRYFSDPVHLNPRGAERYTRELAELFSAHLGIKNQE